MQENNLIPHLFRSEFSRITSVLCKYLGTDHIETAEDVAGETFLQAMEIWPYKGIPDNPTAWLYTVAKNKAKNLVRRQQLFTQKIARDIASNAQTIDETEIDLSEQNITDSQLQMMFAICHPSIPEEAQIGLALRILCGFGITEIANALLSNKETINKRLVRAREKLRQGKIKIEFPSEREIEKRLSTVLTTLYLLFNEGYYSESHPGLLREELCLEAMRLTHMLAANERTNTPEVNALLALMCFHASRFEARKKGEGYMVLYDQQDVNLWNTELIARGAELLHKASQGERLSAYHLEAHIAWWMTQKQDTKEKWETVLQLYDYLLQNVYSPMAALNRAYAISKAGNLRKAIAEAEQLQMNDNHFYHALLGELYRTIDRQKALQHYKTAAELSRTAIEKENMQIKILALSGAG